MDKDTLKTEVTRILQEGHSVACALGRFDTRLYAAYQGRNPMTGGLVLVPSKRLPIFLPSDAFLVSAFGEERVPGALYARPRPEPGSVYVYALGAREDPPLNDHHDNDDAEDTDANGSVHPECPSEAIEMGSLADEIAGALARGKLFKIPGLGTFGRRRLRRRRLRVDDGRRIADADLDGKLALVVRWSQLLTQALNGWSRR